MEQPVSSFSSDTHLMLSTAPGTKLMTISKVPWLLSSSQDPICTEGSGMGHLCPWVMAQHCRMWQHPAGSALLRVPGHDMSPATQFGRLCTNFPSSCYGSRLEGEWLLRKALAHPEVEFFSWLCCQRGAVMAYIHTTAKEGLEAHPAWGL